MGIDTEGSINHPVILTEAVCNPVQSRQFMNELLFECYQVPSLLLGVDALFSLYQNFSEKKDSTKDSLVVRLGYQTTHILPVIGTTTISTGHIYQIYKVVIIIIPFCVN